MRHEGQSRPGVVIPAAGVGQTSAVEVRGLTGDLADGAVFQRRVVPRRGIARFFPSFSSRWARPSDASPSRFPSICHHGPVNGHLDHKLGSRGEILLGANGAAVQRLRAVASGK